MGSPITVDIATAAKFHEAGGVTPVCTEGGEVLGYFAPSARSAGARAVPEFKEEDLERWESEPGGRTLKEIMADLSKLP